MTSIQKMSNIREDPDADLKLVMVLPEPVVCQIKPPRWPPFSHFVLDRR